MLLRPTGSRGPFQYRAVARLREGITFEQARQRLGQATKLVNRRFSTPDSGASYSLADLQERFVGHTRSTLLLMLGAAGMVLLIATVNVANLALTRASSRSHEIAVRSVLGAGRLRLLGQFLSEGILLSLAGGLLGCLLSVWLVEVLLASYAGRLQVANAIAVDGRTLLFALAASLLCGVLFSMAPASQMLGSRLAQQIRTSLRRNGRHIAMADTLDRIGRVKEL